MHSVKVPFFEGLSGRLLIALAFVALISVGGLGLAAYLNQRAALETQVKAQLTSIADLKKEQILTWLQERQADVELLAINKLNQDHFTQILSPQTDPQRKAEFTEFLTDNFIGMQESRVGYSEIIFADTDGRVVVATRPELVGQKTRHNEAFRQTLASFSGMYTQDIHYDPQSGLTKMAFGHVVHPLDLKTGEELPEVIGVVIITVNMDETIYPLIRAWPGMGATGETLLVRAEGKDTLFLNNLRFDNDAALKLKVPAASSDAKPAHYSSRGAEGIIQTPDYRSVPVLAAYRHIPEINWGFVAKEDLEEAFAPVDALAHWLGGVALAVLVATGGISLAISRTLTRPLDKLVEGTRAVAAGNLNTKIDVERNDEIGALAESFRTMVTSLEQRQQQVEIAHEAIQRSAEDLKISSEVLHNLNATPEVTEVFPEIVKALREILGFETINLALLDESHQWLNVVAMDHPRAVPLKRMRRPVADTAAGEDLLAGRPHLTPHLLSEIEFPLEKRLYEAGYRSRVTLPLRIGDKSIGVMNIGWTEPEGFEPSQIPLLSQIASAMALAVERSRLFEETRRRSTELTALHELSLAVNGSLEDPSRVMQMAVDRTVHLLGALGAGIFLSDENGELQVGAIDSPGISLVDDEFSILKGIWESFSTSNEPIQVIQIADLPQESYVVQKRLEQGVALTYVIRLVHGKKQLGMLGVLWPHPHVTDAEKQLAQTIAQIISPAIAHSQQYSFTYEQLQQTNQRLTLVNQISRHMSAILDMEQLLAEVVPMVQSGLGYEHVGIGLVEDDEIVFQVLTNGQRLTPEFRLNLKEQSIAAWVVTHNEALFVPDVSQDDRHYQHPAIHIRSILAVPIRLAEKVSGVLMVAANEIAAFNEGDQTILQAIADQLALALQNAQLYGQMRERAIKALQESEERLRSIYDAANDAIFLIDPEHNHIIDANPKASELLEYTQEELAGLSVKKIHPSEMELINRIWDETLQRGTGQSNDLTCLTKSGKIIPAEASYSKVQIRDRHYVLAMVRDVTERKQLEEQLRQSQKMEAIGQLAGGVAHDFNNILTVITGYSELLLAQMSDEDVRKDIEQIQKAGERASSLTRQLLAFSRRQVLQPKVLDLNSIMTDMEKMLRRLIGEDIELETNLESPLRRIKTDPGQIEQVILNLAVNARDAMPRGGKLTIETANVVLDDFYACQHLGLEAGNYVLLSVSDTGVGMDTQTQERIFEPFFTTKTPEKGTGLGLATVYGIVSQSGGAIHVYSKLNEGTTFEIYLPQIEALDTWPTDLNSDQPSQTLNGSETILLVEDAAGVRALAGDTLKKYGYQVLEAKNGEEALRITKQYQGPIDLILTDVVMPQMSGPELAGCVATFHPNIKIIYMSGYTDNPVVQHDALGSDTLFIQKPFSPVTLARKVRTVLNEVAALTKVEKR